MISHFRHLRSYFHQITNTRLQLSGFTLTVPTQSNVNHEVTRKEKSLSAANRCHWTLQFYRLQSLSSSSSGYNNSRQSERDARTLMVAGLSSDTTVVALRECFSKKWEVTDCRIARHKMTGTSRGFGFVEFATVEQAKHALEFDHFIDGKEVSVKISGTKELEDKYRIFVGGLPKETSGDTLHEHFSKYGDICACSIVRNEDNLSRGFGYVTYKCQASIDRVLNSQPHHIENKDVFVKHSTPRRRELTLFIGNLSPKTTDESLREHFSKYGQLLECNVKSDRQTGQSRGFGYVGFESQEELNRALNEEHVIDGVEVKLDHKTSELDLVVNSLPQNISEESLKNSLWDFFSRYGRVRDCRFIKNSAGTITAFVSLSSKDEISRTLNARPHRIDGKLVDTHLKYERYTLIVNGLPKDATDEDLEKTFSKVGKPVHWEVMRDWKEKTNRPLGYGYVSFSSAEEVDQVMEGIPYFIHRSALTVQRRLERKKETIKHK
ncbi:RNA recognition motif domain-containing protein [Ditylenchus destructor]|nr:RNA recognition motif domain-containing protein [Ditylenchus destructor]